MFKIIYILLLLTGLLFGSDSTKIIDINLQNEQRGKSFGVEVNPVFLLLSRKNDKIIRGSFALFNISRKIELVFPIEYIDRKDPYRHDGPINYNRYTIDCQLHYFLKETQNGLFCSTGLRYTYEYGKGIKYIEKDKYHTINKIGVGIGIGYRYFSHCGFYWGISLFAGRFFAKEYIHIDNLYLLQIDPNKFASFEIFKFGYAFK